MKETIEFERPEGLPKGAVPAVTYVAPKPGWPDRYETFQPNGILRSTLTAGDLRHAGLPVPERTHTLTVELTESQLIQVSGAGRGFGATHVKRILADAALRTLSELTSSRIEAER